MSKGEKTHREWFQYLSGIKEHEVLHEVAGLRHFTSDLSAELVVHM